MMIRYVLRWLFVVAAAVVGFGYLARLANEWHWGRVISPVAVLAPPYLHTGDHVAKTAFRPGESVFVHVTTRRTLSCLASIHQRVVSFEGDDRNRPIIWKDYLGSHGWTKAGTFDSDYYTTIPDNIPPGQYFYERTTTYQCEGVDDFRQEEPLISFKLAGK